MTQSQIEHFLMQELGLKKILWLNHGALIGDDTDAHIDTLARFCAVDTIAYVKCKDSQDVHYQTLKRMEDELKEFKDLSGKKYKLVALPMPDACYDQEGNRLPATYANFLLGKRWRLGPFLWGQTRSRSFRPHSKYFSKT